MIANLTVFPPTHYCDVHNKEYTSILRIKISTRPLYQYLQYYQGGCHETCPAITLIMARSIGALFIVLWFSLSQYGMQDHHFLEVKWELWYWHQNQNPTWQLQIPVYFVFRYVRLPPTWDMGITTAGSFSSSREIGGWCTACNNNPTKLEERYLAPVDSGSMSIYHQKKVGGDIGFTDMHTLQNPKKNNEAERGA